MKKLLTIAAVAGALVTAANAADFGGFRVELHDAWDHAKGGAASADGYMFGVGFGYDVVVDDYLVFGTEGNVDLATTHGFGAEAKRDLSALARIGLKAGDNVLLYTKAGYSNGRLNYGTNSWNNDGLRVAGGVEYAFAKRFYAKLEYDYTNYEANLERHQVVAGVGVRF